MIMTCDDVSKRRSWFTDTLDPRDEVWSQDWSVSPWESIDDVDVVPEEFGQIDATQFRNPSLEQFPRFLLRIATGWLIALANDGQIESAIHENDESEPENQPLFDYGKDLIVCRFLHEVYSYSRDGKIHAAGDLIFDFVHNSLMDLDFSLCDYLLEQIDVAYLSSSLMITFLATTYSVKKKLSNREAYYVRAKIRLTEEKDEIRASKIIDKYR